MPTHSLYMSGGNGNGIILKCSKGAFVPPPPKKKKNLTNEKGKIQIRKINQNDHNSVYKQVKTNKNYEFLRGNPNYFVEVHPPPPHTHTHNSGYTIALIRNCFAPKQRYKKKTSIFKVVNSHDFLSIWFHQKKRKKKKISTLFSLLTPPLKCYSQILCRGSAENFQILVTLY